MCARLSLHLLQRLLTARVTQCLCTEQPVLRSSRPPEDGEIPKCQLLCYRPKQKAQSSSTPSSLPIHTADPVKHFYHLCE